MADERDFELLDDYLTRRMPEEDHAAFEQKLRADPDLQHEYALQKRMIDGIKEVRAAELKRMLNQVPIPSGGQGSALASKILIGTVVSIMIAAAGYWYFGESDSRMMNPGTALQEQQQRKKPESPVTEIAEPQKTTTQKEPVLPVTPKVEPEKNQTSAGTEHSKPSLAKKPEPLQAPEETGSTKKDADQPEERVTTAPGTSGVIVETDGENDRYSFHYQFQNGKVYLFGPFEQNPYEVLELANDKPSRFLYYKDRYYALDDTDAEVRNLTPVTDPALLKELSKYHSPK